MGWTQSLATPGASIHDNAQFTVSRVHWNTEASLRARDPHCWLGRQGRLALRRCSGSATWARPRLVIAVRGFHGVRRKHAYLPRKSASESSCAIRSSSRFRRSLHSSPATRTQLTPAGRVITSVQVDWSRFAYSSMRAPLLAIAMATGDSAKFLCSPTRNSSCGMHTGCAFTVTAVRTRGRRACPARASGPTALCRAALRSSDRAP